MKLALFTTIADLIDLQEKGLEYTAISAPTKDPNLGRSNAMINISLAGWDFCISRPNNPYISISIRSVAFF